MPNQINITNGAAVNPGGTETQFRLICLALFGAKALRQSLPVLIDRFNAWVTKHGSTRQVSQA